MCFNRYMVECEFAQSYANLRLSLRFNRYMVECECYRYCYIYIPIFVLIDTWWNVNKVRAKVFEEGKAVLIDTWWNVNTNKLGAGVEVVEVLIDTWWNVNQSISTKEFVSVAGFNRYMVECESFKVERALDRIKCFNRYMVECESGIC